MHVGKSCDEIKSDTRNSDQFRRTFEMRCYRKVLKILSTKVNNADTSQDLNIAEDLFIESILARTMKYFGCVKTHRGLEPKLNVVVVLEQEEVPGHSSEWTEDILRWCGSFKRFSH